MVGIVIGMAIGTISSLAAQPAQFRVVITVLALIFSIAGALVGKSKMKSWQAIWAWSIIGSLVPIIAATVLLIMYCLMGGCT